MNNKFFLVAFVILIAFYIFSNQKSTQPIKIGSKITITPTPTHKPDEIYVKRVIDGDTIVLNTNETVRYIGINTPELKNGNKNVECFAVRAFLANKSLLEGKIVRLEKDISNVDKFGRLLRYVYIDNPSFISSSSGEIKELFINNYLVEHGYAQVASYPPDIKYQQIFLSSQQRAKKNSVGLWKECK